MSPALVQALQRLVVVAIVGALTAVGINLTLLNGALPNAALFIPVLTAVISAALKYLGGATVPAASVATATLGYETVEPPFWAV
jgi:hypothetical protein